jgi:hypothetical protein
MSRDSTMRATVSQSPGGGEETMSQGAGVAHTRKEEIWLACAPKTCCYTSVVVPSGRDVWRIARALEAPPWTFLVYFPADRPRRDAFRLGSDGATYRLALAKRPTRRTKRPHPCIFLLRTRHGHHRCGLGELRPAACHTYPSELIGGVLCMQAEGCTCRHWSLADVDIDEETAAVRQRQVEAEEYCAVVAQWNEMTTTVPPNAAPDFFDYCTYLLAAYDALAEETGEPE